MSLYFKFYHGDIHSSIRTLAYETNTPWLLAIGIVGFLLDLASEHEPRGMLPSVEPGFYSFNYHEPKIDEIVALMLEKGLLDAKGKFTDWAEKQACFKTDAADAVLKKDENRKSKDRERKSKYRGAAAWQKAGWERIWKATWSQASEKGARIAWFDVACPWIKKHCSESEDVLAGRMALEDACTAYVEKHVLRAVAREKVLAKFKEKSSGRLPYGLPRWIRELLWRNPEYNEGWPVEFAKARKSAKKNRGDGQACRFGRRRDTVAERDARLEKNAGDALAEHLQEMGIDPALAGIGPEKVHAEVVDGNAGSTAPPDGGDGAENVLAPDDVLAS